MKYFPPPFAGKHVLMLDPGVLTGWAVCLDGALFLSGEADFLGTGTVVKDFCNQQGEKFAGWERFDITPHTYQMKGSQEAMHVIGMAKYLTLSAGCQLITPMARQGKNQVPDGMLKALKFYRPGHGGHANDAMRHLISWMLSQHYLPGSVHGMISQYLKEESELRNRAVRGDRQH